MGGHPCERKGLLCRFLTFLLTSQDIVFKGVFLDNGEPDRLLLYRQKAEGNGYSPFNLPAGQTSRHHVLTAYL